MILVVALAALAALALALSRPRPSPAERLQQAFEGRALAALELTLDAAARKALGAAPREYVAGTLRFEGQDYPVEVRLKGHRSMQPLTKKPAFKLAFDRHPEGQPFFGHRRLTLNNLVDDPTGSRERLAYRLHAAAGVMSPRTGHAELRVNGEPYGLYLMVEAIDEEFVRRHVEGEVGVMYEGEYGCDVVPGHVDGFDRDVGKDPGRAALHALTAALAAAESPFAAEGPLNVPEVLRYLAVSAVIGDFDGYRHAHNYRVYQDPSSGKWQLLPWGLDRVFQKHLGVLDSQGWLAKRCFADAGCRLEYFRTLRAVLGIFEAERLSDAADDVWSLIEDAASDDPRKPYDSAKMKAERQELARFIEERPDKVRGQLECIDERGQELDRDGDGHGCMDCDDSDPGVGPHATERCDGVVDDDCSGLVDDAPECACPEVEVLGKTYQLCNLPMPWVEAERFCEAQGLVLARIDSRLLSRKLQVAARRELESAWWIGYSDRDEEGHFRWRDGEAGTFRYWKKGQPNDRSCEEDCAALDKEKGGRWLDTPCNQHLPFICGAGVAVRVTGPVAAPRAGERAAAPSRSAPDAGAQALE